MKIAFFDTKPYDIPYFEKYANDLNIEIKFFETRLTQDTVDLAKGYDGVCVFVNDTVNAQVIDRLAEFGVSVVALRCAGFNNVDIKYAHGKVHVLRVPASPLNYFAASRLRQWPCKIELVPVNAPYFDGANLLIAADCTAYAYGSFHNDFIKNHITLIGCPKLDEGAYAEKLTSIIRNNDIKSVKIVRMEVPCCGGLENAVRRALKESGKFIPWQVVTITTDGKILD